MVKRLISLIGFLLISNSVSASLNYSQKGITDDEISASIKYPRPPSVSNLISSIRKIPDLSEIKSINLSGNNITLAGASQILRFASEELPNLKKLNLSNNQLRDWRGKQGYADFEVNLIKLLAMNQFKSLDLRVNGIACSSWFTDIDSRIDENLIDKIKWDTYQMKSMPKIPKMNSSIPKIPKINSKHDKF
jgi:hypothetical protein